MAAQLSITTELDNRVFVPGEQIKGRVTWMGAEGNDDTEVRLFYYTSGKGTRDVEVVERQPIEQAGASGERDFFFSIPADAVPSLSGKLVSVQWGIEFQVEAKNGDTALLEITISPTGEELSLYKYDDGNLPKYSGFKFGKGKTGSRLGKLKEKMENSRR